MEQQEKDLWQKNKWVLYTLLFVAAALWLLKNCQGSESTSGTKITSVKVTTAEVKGDFEPQKPVHTPITGQVTGQLPGKYRGSTAEVENSGSTEPSLEVQNLIAENQRLVQNFKKETDSLKQKLYEQAIQLNQFSSHFEDDNIKIDMSGIVQGEIKSIKPTYTWKEKTFNVDVPVKETVFTMRAGIEYGNSIELNKSTFKGNFEFENKNGNSFSYGYDTDRRHWVGYKFTVFNINK